MTEDRSESGTGSGSRSTDRESELRDRVLREVHHKVQNNLQMLSSIIGMQIRRTASKQEETLLGDMRRRIRGLAKYHHDLYHQKPHHSLRADLLLHDLAHQLLPLGDEEIAGVKLILQLDAVELPPNKGSSLAMVATESLILARRIIVLSPTHARRCRLALKRRTQRTIFSVEIDSSPTEDVFDREGSVSRSLIAAFASELDGTVEYGNEGENCKLTITF